MARLEVAPHPLWAHDQAVREPREAVEHVVDREKGVGQDDAFLALDYMLDRFTWLVSGLVVRPERMRANLDASHGLFFSQRLLLALVESGLPRNEAYRLVQRHALRAHEEEQDFRELVRADEEIAGRVDLDAIFDLGWYTRHLDAVFERQGALARKEEPIHA